MGLRESISAHLGRQLKLRIKKMGGIGNEGTAKQASMLHDNFNELGKLSQGLRQTKRNLLESREGDADAFAHKFRKMITNKKMHNSAKLPQVSHSSKHPGFKAVQNKIQHEGFSHAVAGAILASRTRNASKSAHRANPRLNRVKG